ncbi:MAG TPA: tryptophan--tRNA ligase [Thermoplasmata archaeon]|nr:tryptophan--tRNA ligase [Thermoplasmata archaeon]
MPAPEEFVVTPYEVKGTIDYERLRQMFGTQELNAQLLERLKYLAGGELPALLRRDVYVSHRDLAPLLEGFAAGRRFVLYSGRGPSGPMHTAHLIPFDLCKWFQDRFHAPMYIQLTDDEKFWLRPQTGREETRMWGMDNLLDILAVGFDPERTRVFFDTRSIGTMYSLAVDAAKRIPYSTVKAVFGFKPSTNIGLVFYTALQTVPALYPSWRAGRSVPCLIPCGIDQDPHFRITRDLAESLGYPKPAMIHNRILPGLLGGKMSSGGPEKDNALFLNDPPKEIDRKVRNAFTGGRATVEEQRRLGATPEICSVWALWRTKFARDDAEYDTITADCRSGAMLCGECKSKLLERVHPFFEEHAARREKVRDYAESLILEARPGSTEADGGPPVPEP